MKALLFDMDGVLVDVSYSYRLTIQKVVEFFLNINITTEMIQQYKNQGGFNNDWDLSWQILHDQGKKIDKSRIIKIFQKFYLGKDHNGFIKNEQWLLKQKNVERIFKRYKTGIVTGRSRSEAIYTLNQYNMQDYFPALITMDDLPSGRTKPDPLGISTALKMLICKSGYYFGDTIDDMIAAQKAGILPIGVIPPGQKKEPLSRYLHDHGALNILTDINDLEEVLL